MNPTWLLVACVYGLAIWLARRAGVELRWRFAALFYLLVLLFLREAMTQDFVNLPVDFLRSMPPWAYLTRNHHGLNDEMNDLVLQIVPWAHQVRASWLSMHVPLWNALDGCGYPLLANGQSSALSFFRLLALPLSLGHAMTAEGAMKLLIALTFAFLFCRRRGYGELASAIGAASFGFSTFIIFWLHFPLTTVACFLPAVLYQIDLLVEQRTYGRFVFAALLWTAMLFGGHPETASHIFFLAMLYVVWILVVERPLDRRDSLRFVLTLCGALAVAALLAAPFLAPFAQGLTRSKRFQELRSVPNSVTALTEPSARVILLQPHFFGHRPEDRPWAYASAELITGFAGVLGIAAWLALLVRAIVGRRWRERETFFVIATPIVLGIILGWPIVSVPFHVVFRLAANARLRLLLCFLLSVQAAAVVDFVQRERARAYLVAIAVVSALFLWLMIHEPFPSAWYHDVAMLAILPSLCVLLVAAFVPLSGRAKPFVTMLLTVVVIAELWTAGIDWNPTVLGRWMYPTTPLLRALQGMNAAQSPEDPMRMVGEEAMLFPNVGALYGLSDVRAHDPMANGRYLGVLRLLIDYDTASYFATWNKLDSRLLDYLGVRWVVAKRGTKLADTERFRLAYDGRDGRIFENHDALPRFFPVPNVTLEFRPHEFVSLLIKHTDWVHTAVLNALPVENDQERSDLLNPRPANSPEATLTLNDVSDGEYRMHVHAPRYSLIVSSVAWWPGWKVEGAAESSEPLQVNGAFIGFVVPPGDHDLRVVYDPPAFRLGAIVALLTLLGLIATPIVRRRRRTTAA